MDALPEFNVQRRHFEEILTRYVDYINIAELYDARKRMIDVGFIIDSDIPIFVAFADYVGSLKRIAYYKLVHRRGYDVRSLADAVTITFMFNSVYAFAFEPYLRRKEVKSAIEKTRYPAWTKLGLVGGGTQDLVKYGNTFSAYMDELKELEA